MLSRNILFIAIGISATIGVPLIQNRASDGCQNYVILSSRATTELQGPSLGSIGMISTTLSTISGGLEYDVVYPAAADITQLTTLIGSADIERFINAGLITCPQQKYALLGYSQGVTVTLEALQKLTGTDAENAIIAVVLLGNPYQVANQISTIDENGGSTTRANDGSLLYIDPSLGLSQHWVDSGKVRNICYRGDLVCNGVAFDTLNGNHLLYGLSASVQNFGSDFLISKLG